MFVVSSLFDFLCVMNQSVTPCQWVVCVGAGAGSDSFQTHFIYSFSFNRVQRINE